MNEMNEITLRAKNGNELLSDILLREGVDFDLPCAGNHTCGKCKIKVRGELNELSPSEAVMLSEADRAAGLRMACFARAKGEIFVSLPERMGQRILSEGVGTVSVHRPMMGDGLGAAIDVGTTTLVCRLYGPDGTALATVSELNRQQRFGADVISRIQYGILHGNEPIHHAIVSQLEEMLSKAASAAGVPRSSVTHAVATGNTTMLHFLAGLDPRGIGFAPFVPQSLFDVERDDVLRGVTLYLPPCVSAYVGADLICSVLASGMHDRADTALIVDIGTNGEMALLHRGVLHSCSTAAGPAFEGAGISQGMIAASGAISHVRYDRAKKTVTFETLDDALAKGICGSGAIDAIAMLLAEGALSPSGRFLLEGHVLAPQMSGDEDDPRFVFPGCGVAVTQADVRQIQLAKAAVYSGVVTLSQACGLSPQELGVLYVCGGFGSFLNLASAESIRLLPESSKDRTVVLGNGALMGAAMLLLDSRNRERTVALAADCNYIELSSDEDFMDNYVASMTFGDPEED